jgi:uncharacterized protein (TIGR02246 family)
MLEDGFKQPEIASLEMFDVSLAQVESEIRQCLDDWIESVNSGYAESISALYTPDAVLLPTFDARIRVTPAERLNYFINFKTRRGLHATVNDCFIESFGRDAGVASGIYTFCFLGDDGTDQVVKARYTFVFARQSEGDWLIAAHHSSVVPH